MEPLAYHVLLEGRRMGPYDRRTIVGLRIKKRLQGEHQLEASDGSRLTVAQLFAAETGAPDFNPMRSGSYSSAKFTCGGSVIDSERGAVEIPAFRGEVEVRVHPDVLRIAGSHRHAFGWKDGRVKLPLRNIAHVRVTGSRVDLWLCSTETNAASTVLQRIGLELFSAETALELLRWLPDAQVWPETAPAAAPAARAPVAAVSPLLWAAVLGIVLVAAIVLLVLLRRSF
jgi:hypothetical protein